MTFLSSSDEEYSDFEDDENALDSDSEANASSASHSRRAADDEDEYLDAPVLLMPPLDTYSSAPPILTNASQQHETNAVGTSERSPLLQRKPSITFRDAPEVVAAGHVSGYGTHSSAPRSPELRAIRPKSSAQRLGLSQRHSSDSLALSATTAHSTHEHKKSVDPVTGNSTFGQSVGYLFRPFHSLNLICSHSVLFT